jgi:hypothetical protein
MIVEKAEINVNVFFGKLDDFLIKREILRVWERSDESKS